MRCVVALVCALGLVACGGGGGGADNSGSGGGGGPVVSGLVPAAPAPGAVLVSDASTLRVLRPGATWIYRGADQPANEGPRPYTNVVTHVAAGSATTEQQTDFLAAGADTSNWQIVAGTVRTTTSLADFGVAQPLDIEVLRSPVRTQDQYTHFDRRLSDAIDDLDGDGRREALDLAVYSLVVGEEVLNLASRRAVRAVRVDLVSLARARGSAQGVLSEVVRIVQSVWYAQGVGVVRTRVESPSANTPGGQDLVTEELEYWDGSTEGLGASPVTAISRADAGATALVGVVAAARLGSGALVITRGDPFDGLSYAATRVDERGRPQQTQDFMINLGGGDAFPGVQVTSFGNRVRLLHRRGSESSLAVVGFNSSGARDPLADAVLPLGVMIPPAGAFDPPFVSASTAGASWVLWLRPRNVSVEGPFSVDLVLAGIAANGALVAAPTALASMIDARLVSTVRLAGGGNRVLATWTQSAAFLTVDPPVQYYAVADDTGAVLAIKSNSNLSAARYPAVGPTGDLFLCWVQGSVSPVSAVRLDAAFDPLRSSSGPLNNEIVSPPWASPDTGFNGQCHVDDLRMTLTGGELALRWPWEQNPMSLYSSFDVWLPGSAPPATATSSQRIARHEAEQFSLITSIVLPDRVLKLGTNLAGQTAVVMAWRPPR